MTKPRRRKKGPRLPIVGAVYPDFTLADDQWSEIASPRFLRIAPGKADQARKELQAVLGMYRLSEPKRQATMHESARRAALRDRLSDAKKLLRHLDDPETAQLLEQQVEDRHFVREIEHEAGKTGPQTGAAYVLVHYLMGFAQRYGGKQLRRPNGNRVVAYVCEIADPNITGGTIDMAMKYFNTHRGQTLDEADAEARAMWWKKQQRKALRKHRSCKRAA
jgi:hypothetical protein